MPNGNTFAHLQLLLRFDGPAKLSGFPPTSPQTIANRNARIAHSASLQAAGSAIAANWKAKQAERERDHLPVVPKGVPILLTIDPSLDLDVLREKFDFEIVAEQEDGFVIVAAHDVDLAAFQSMAKAFEVQVRGSARIAFVHALYDDPNQTDRLLRILSDDLAAAWPKLDEHDEVIVDVGISCVGTQEIPIYPERGKRDSDADWAAKEHAWSQARADAYASWDSIKLQREAEIEQFVDFYEAEILKLMDGSAFDAVLPDSFTIRLKISGRGLKDFLLNYPYIFEVVEPEEIGLPQQQGQLAEIGAGGAAPQEPPPNAPSVCVLDSGMQEEHTLLSPAIDKAHSYCFLPGKSGDTADYVKPGGHGTRVGGAVLYGESVPKAGTPALTLWLQNARVLDDRNTMPVELFPPQVIRAAVERFHNGPRHTRIFNHSINAQAYCRTRYMSAWAAEIDHLSSQHDILIIQSAGNLATEGNPPFPGVKNYLEGGCDYPKYFYEPSARIANPAQSLQALTVGSIAYGLLEEGQWRSFASRPGHPSAFSRSGPGIWSVIKPEVVDYGGDDVRTKTTPVQVQAGGAIAAACPELVRSTLHSAGPAFDRDDSGTSFSAPKVARIAAHLQALLPMEPALLYRALIVQSARWPDWAEEKLAEARRLGPDDAPRREELISELTRVVRCIGFGAPDESRATLNTDHRVTFVTQGEARIKAGECHIYEVPIPLELRRQGDEFDIRIDITLSYAAQPRRTRRNLRRYLSTWVDWKASRLGEGIDAFRVRALKDETFDGEPVVGSALPWTLNESSTSGFVRETKRNNGTVQKDWAVVKSNALPSDFCIAVVGHEGWSRDPDTSARYTAAVTFEILGQEIPIYEPLRVSAEELRLQLTEEVEVEPLETE
jgi:hypothetical protein